jgi:hypothetical protein
MMDDLKLEPLESLETAEPSAQQSDTSNIQSWNLRRLILPTALMLGIIFAIGLYLLFAPESEKIMAQVFSYEISIAPKISTVVVSITNKQDKQAIIEKMYPIIYGNEYSDIHARSIEGSTIEGTALPLILNPGEIRILRIKYSVEKSYLDQFAGKLKDSSHIIVFKNGPPAGQLEGTLGLGWSVVDADGENYANFDRITSYILTPTPPGFADRTALTHYWIISGEPFELCTNEGIVIKGE